MSLMKRGWNEAEEERSGKREWNEVVEEKVE